MFIRTIALLTALFALSACATDGGGKTEVFGEISGGIEHTVVK